MWLIENKIMKKEHKYSKEWLCLIESAITHQKKINSFFNIEQDIRLRDLKEALKERESLYYALKVVENISDDIIQKLLNELIIIVIYGNVSNSYIAKKIILQSNKQLFRKEICEIVIKNSLIEKDNIYIIKDMALFLYELQYKKELLQFVKNNIIALRESEFIENDEDLNKLYNMED